ncbi:WD40 repeat domain-containing protein [Acuticoccus sediminis]|uniref:WD40 repeat domain-containing protein n=1 Tax=Acuticoccus sediminis TaxID=2184697 RepID=UPI001CFC55F1|nr:WD40 repeat domain-containing protein [Acuticoccus sediminis]
MTDRAADLTADLAYGAPERAADTASGVWNEAWDDGGVDTGHDLGTSHLAPGASGVALTGPANVVALTPLASRPEPYAFAAGFGDGTVALYRGPARDGAGADVQVRPGARHEAAVSGVITLSGAVVSAGQDGTVRGADGVITAPGSWCEHLTASPAGETFAVAAGRAVVLGTLSGATVRLADHPSSVSGLAFAPDGRQLAASHYNGVTIWSVGRGTKVRTLAWKGSHIGVTWSPDGRFVVSATQERELHVWDLAADKDFRLGGYAAKVRSLAWLGAPAHLLASGADAITAWPFGDVGPGVLPPKEIGFGHKALVTRVAAHPSRPQVAGGYSNGTVLVGGVKKGEASFVRLADGAPVTALAYTANGTLIAATRSGRIEAIRFDKEVQ